MATFLRSIVLGLALGVSRPSGASAGMPFVTPADLARTLRSVTETGLTDVARQRLEVLSFFLLGLLACAGVIRRIWNGLRKDFPVLPRLSYARAMGLIVLWGLLFVLVLTMISGARELMTPGAWEKKGLTYKLVPPPTPPPVEAEITARFEAITRLGDRLRDYARGHGGALPGPEPSGEVDDALGRVPSPPGGRYVYLSGRTPNWDTGRWPSLLAYEPESVGRDRLVLMTDGEVRWMPATEIARILASEGR